jgi:hypothetical protein
MTAVVFSLTASLADRGQLSGRSLVGARRTYDGMAAVDGETD